MLERLAADEFHHHQERIAFPRELVDGGDAWVIEPGDCDGLGAKALDCVVFEEVGVQGLDRNDPVEGFVDCPVDDPHPATAELLDDPVFSDSFANHDG